MTNFPVVIEHIPNLPQTPYELGVGLYENVTFHDTGTDGDTADAEANYEKNNWNKPGSEAFVAEFIDDVRAIQVSDPRFDQWGAGPTDNKKAVHLELCHDNTLAGFNTAYDHWTQRGALYLFARGLGVYDGQTALSHREVSAKWHETDHADPDEYLKRWNKSWNDVISTVGAKYHEFETAVRNGQTIALDGIPTVCITNPLLKDHPVPAPVPSKLPVLHRGDRNAYVKVLQTMLNRVNANKIVVDGDFGTITYGVVRAFQQSHNCHPVDGIVGPITWSALKVAVAKQ